MIHKIRFWGMGQIFQLPYPISVTSVQLHKLDETFSKWLKYVDGLLQDWSISSALAMIVNFHKKSQENLVCWNNMP